MNIDVNNNVESARNDEVTYSTRLPAAGEWLQLVRIAELDEDGDSPFSEVLMLLDADLACTADTYKAVSAMKAHSG